MNSKPIHNEEEEDFDLRKIAPTLAGLEKREMHQPPPGYFDELPGRIHAQVRVPMRESFNLKRLFSSIFSRGGVATMAMCVLLVLASIWVSQWEGSTTTEYAELFAELTQEELIAAIDVNSVSDQELLDVMGEEPVEFFSEMNIPELMETEETNMPEEDALDLDDIDTDELFDYYY